MLSSLVIPFCGFIYCMMMNDGADDDALGHYRIQVSPWRRMVQKPFTSSFLITRYYTFTFVNDISFVLTPDTFCTFFRGAISKIVSMPTI